MLLHDKLVERLGPDAVRLGSRVTGYRKNADGSVSALIEHADGSTSEANGALLIGADGIHSAVRAQMHPAQPPIHWGGAVMWRGTTWGKPIRTGSSFVGLGTHRQRMVFYPISHPDPQTGLSMINWIAEVTMDNSEGWKQSGWFRQVAIADFVHHFDDWVWDWLDVPALIRQRRQRVREPDDRPRSGADLAGRPGGAARRRRARRCIRPARTAAARRSSMRACSAPRWSSTASRRRRSPPIDEKLCGPISQLILRNRGAGPFGLLNMVDERCGGTFDNIDDVIPPKERAEFMAGYKAAAGFAIEKLNKAPRTIPDGARVRIAQAVCKLSCCPPLQHPSDAQIFVDIGPVNTHRHDLEMRAFAGRSLLQPRIPFERRRDRRRRPAQTSGRCEFNRASSC